MRVDEVIDGHEPLELVVVRRDQSAWKLARVRAAGIDQRAHGRWRRLPATQTDPSSELLWSIIDDARARCEGRAEQLAEALAEQLARMPASEREQVIAQLDAALDRADDWTLLAASSALSLSHPSARAFLERRLWLVAQGRAVFEQALREPERLAELINAGEIGHGYYRELGALLRHRDDYARVLDGEAGEQPAAPRHGTPVPAREWQLREVLTEILRKLVAGQGSLRLWSLRAWLLLLLVGAAAVIAVGGWWAFVLVPAWFVLVAMLFDIADDYVAAITHLDSTRAQGWAAVLHGQQCYELHFDDPAPSEELVARTQARVDVALAWIREQAAAYGHELSFTRTAVEYGVCERPVTVGEDQTLEAAHVVELRRCVRRRIGARQGAFVLVFTREGDYRACAWPSYGPDDDPLELCACPPNAWPSTIAHEILHLFGAQDLYLETPTEHDDAKTQIATVHHVLDYAASRVAQWSITRSIMRLSNHPHAVVDPLTAYTVGWRTQPRGRVPEPLRTPWAEE